MKCYSIKLVNRLEEKDIFQSHQRRCHPILLQNHECRASSPSDQHSDSSQAQLSVLNLMLPKDAKTFNTGSSTKRWSDKRPRLKSGKSTVHKEDVDNLDVPNIIEELECKLEEETLIREEIDPDIQRLLEGTHVDETLDVNDNKKISFDDGIDSKGTRKSKRKHKKKSKEKRKDKEKKKIKKSVSFSLSKPPTPQTEQVIRVEVVTNFSVEFEDVPRKSERRFSLDDDDSTSKFHATKLNDDFLYEMCFKGSQNLFLESKKAVLFPRCGK